MKPGVPLVELELTRTPDELAKAAATPSTVKKQRILGKEGAMANWVARNGKVRTAPRAGGDSGIRLGARKVLPSPQEGRRGES
jgi:hypothetical protein